MSALVLRDGRYGDPRVVELEGVAQSEILLGFELGLAELFP